MLQDKLRISNKKLEEYETRFKCQEENTQKLVLEYQARLEESEERLRRQQEDKEIQMKGIISRYREMGVLGMAVRQGSLAGITAHPFSGNQDSLEVQAGSTYGFFLQYYLGQGHQCFTDAQGQNFRRGELGRVLLFI